jgi:HEAT repeat protein
VSVFRLPSEDAVKVHGNNSYGGFAWWCAVEPGEYRVEVATPGFLATSETIVVPEDPEGRSQSGCCDKQFWLDVPIERDPAQRGQFDLPELLQLELLDGRDRKPPPENCEVIWQAFHDPGGRPAFDEIRTLLRHVDGAARLRWELAAGKYTVRVGCDGFGETTLAVTLPQASPVVEVLLPPEWKDAEEARAAIPSLVLKLRHDVDERHKAARALVRIGPPAAEPLMELFSDGDIAVRQAAVLAFGNLRPTDPRTLERIVPLLADPESRIRATASQALGGLGEEARGVVPDLIRLLDDPAGHVRSSAASALGMLGPAAREASANLELLLDDEYEWARENAKWALDRIAGRKGLEK